MLTHFTSDATTSSQSSQAFWIDLVDPTDDEIALVRDRHGIEVPSRSALERIEASSRLQGADDRLMMSAPLISGTRTNRWEVAPVGFLLTSELLVTVRFARIESFEDVAQNLKGKEGEGPSAALIAILEQVVDRAADHLERASEAINQTSQDMFFSDPDPKRLRQDTAKIRGLMRKAGQASDRIARVRYTFLSIGRIADFTLDRWSSHLKDEERQRLEAISRDISSLDDFETSLSDRIQFLQDSAVGLISIEQNDVVKILTVVSVVGVPPVLVVGIYGMNFRYMPELGWRLGYPYALALVALSIVLPLLWFKWRDWL